MVRDWRNKASSLEGDNRALNRQISALQETVDKYGEIEKENVTLGRKIVELNREIATLNLMEEQGICNKGYMIGPDTRREIASRLTEIVCRPAV